MKRRVLLIVTLMLGMLTFAGPVAAGCDPGRGSSAANLFVYQVLFASETAVFDDLRADIEEGDVFLESGGNVNQYIEMKGGSSSVRAGINSNKTNGTRLFASALEPSGNVTVYYSFVDSSNQANLRITRITSTKYQVFTGSTLITTFYFDVGFTPKSAYKYVTSNNHGNQIPGRASNRAWFLNATYSTQYGTASWSGSFQAPYPLPAGSSFGGNFWTQDRC